MFSSSRLSVIQHHTSHEEESRSHIPRRTSYVPRRTVQVTHPTKNMIRPTKNSPRHTSHEEHIHITYPTTNTYRSLIPRRTLPVLSSLEASVHPWFSLHRETLQIARPTKRGVPRRPLVFRPLAPDRRSPSPRSQSPSGMHSTTATD